MENENPGEKIKTDPPEAENLNSLGTISDDYQHVLKDIHSLMDGDSSTTFDPAELLNNSDNCMEVDFNVVCSDIGSGNLGENAQMNEDQQTNGENQPLQNETSSFADDIELTDSFMKSEETLNKATDQLNSTNSDTNSNKKAGFRVVISNLPATFTGESLDNLLIPYGNVLEKELCSKQKYAIVYLETEESAEAAVKELNNMTIGDVKINATMGFSGNVKSLETDLLAEPVKVFMSYLKPDFTHEYVENLAEPYGRVIEVQILRNKKNAAFVYMEEESCARKLVADLDSSVLPGTENPVHVVVCKNQDTPEVPTLKMKVSNVPEKMTAQEVRRLFQPYGVILKVVVEPAKNNQSRKAEVYIEQLGDIRSALKDLNDKEIDGCKLSVEPVLEKPVVPLRPKPAPAPPAPAPSSTTSSTSSSPASKKSKKFKKYTVEGPKIKPLFPQHPPLMGKGQGPPRPPPPGLFGRGFQVVPMPSQAEIHYNGPQRPGPGPFGMPQRGPRMRDPEISVLPRERLPLAPGPKMYPNPMHGHPSRGNDWTENRNMTPKRTVPFQYPNSDSFQDYEFDSYYADPVAQSSRQHLDSLQPSMFRRPMQFGTPPQKRPRDVRPLMSAPDPFSFQEESFARAPRPDFNPFEEEPSPWNVPQFQSQSYPPLNLPLGEPEYSHHKFKNNPKRPQSLMQMHSSAPPASFQQPPQRQQQSLQNKYLVPEQIPGPNLTAGRNFASFGGNESYEDYSAVGFDYSNLPAGKGKYYINQKGNMMYRGQRGGRNRNNNHQDNGTTPDYQNPQGGQKKKKGVNNNKNKKKPRAGLGSTPGNPGNPGGLFLSGANLETTQPRAPMIPRQPKIPPKSRRQLAMESQQEYSDWLQNKVWMHQAIPGVVRPAK